MWPDWVIFWTLGNFLNPLATVNLPNLPHSEAITVNVSKSFIFLVKPFFGNFYRHLAIFIWSHCPLPKYIHQGLAHWSHLLRKRGWNIFFIYSRRNLVEARTESRALISSTTATTTPATITTSSSTTSRIQVNDNQGWWPNCYSGCTLPSVRCQLHWDANFGSSANIWRI